jgi:CBS domain-containing protein
MHRPVQLVHATDSVQVAARIMRDANVGMVPVCDDRRHVQGVVTDRDVAVRLAAEARPADKTLVTEVMSRDVVSCLATEDVARAEALMREHHKSRVLITDTSGVLLGVISIADLAHVGAPQAAETLRAVTEREVLTSEGMLRR